MSQIRAAVPIAPLVGAREEAIRLLVPILVVDELDGLKRTRQGKQRWRAAYSLAVIERVVGSGLQGMLRNEDYSALDVGGIPRGRIMMEVVLDPPHHRRRLIGDDELVDQAVSLRSFTGGRPLRFLTFDTGQSMRARAARLETVKVREPIGEEPMK